MPVADVHDRFRSKPYFNNSYDSADTTLILVLLRLSGLYLIELLIQFDPSSSPLTPTLSSKEFMNLHFNL